MTAGSSAGSKEMPARGRKLTIRAVAALAASAFAASDGAGSAACSTWRVIVGFAGAAAAGAAG